MTLSAQDTINAWLSSDAYKSQAGYTAPSVNQNATPAATFSDAQVASYITNNNLSGQSVNDAMHLFGISNDQLGRAQGLMQSNDPSIAAAHNAYLASATPQQDQANRGWFDAAAVNSASTPDQITGVVDDLYRLKFGREPDRAGLEYWQGQVRGGLINSVDQLRASMAAGAQGDDRIARADNASYAYSWRNDIDPNGQLWYDAAKDQWNPNKPPPPPPVAATPSRQFSTDTNRSVSADQTIEGRLNNVLGTDKFGNYTNPVVRQAVDRAMQSFAGRGLLNSSMAQQAAQEAAISKAIEIVGPDAQRFFEQSRANQDWGNKFAQDELQFGYDLQKIAAQSAAQLQNTQLSGDIQQNVAQINRDYAVQANLSSTAASLYQQYNSAIQQIIASDLPPEAKEAAIAQYTGYMKIGMQLQGSIAGDQNLLALMSQLFGK
jgi:hypothetical protein